VLLADYHPSTDRPRAKAQRAAWQAHLQHAYSPRQARQLLDSWDKDDVRLPLDVERRLIAEAGLETEVLWRKGAFTVLLAEH
jgi:hypothetical protein